MSLSHKERKDRKGGMGDENITNVRVLPVPMLPITNGTRRVRGKCAGNFAEAAFPVRLTGRAAILAAAATPNEGGVGGVQARK